MKANMQLLGKSWLLSVVAALILGNTGVVFAQEQTWSYTYNSLGLKETEDGPRTDVNDVTTYTYDASGNVATVTNALGHVVTYNAYDAAGRVLSVTDANGITTLFEYHPRGWLTQSTLVNPDGDDLVTGYAYYADGELQQITSPTGGVVTFEYNGANHLTTTANDLGERIEYVLDAAGNRTEEVIKSASGVIVYRLQTAYDELSRVMDVIGNHGQQDSIEYDANDNPVVLGNARLAETQQQYDALNRVRKIIDPHQEETTFTYDAQDRIRTVTDARGNTTTYTYDGLGNLLSLDSPDTGLTTYLYDSAGNRTRQTDSRGIVTNYTYDALNRLTAVTYPAATGENVTYQYDSTTNGNVGKGRLTRITFGNRRIAYTYNALGLITRKAVTVGSTTRNINYVYSPTGLLAMMTYPSGRQVLYTYDTHGRIATIANRPGAASALRTLIDSITYMPFGPAKSYTYGNGLSHTVTYDLDYRIEAIQVGGINPLLSRNYFYDLTNNIAGLVDGVTAAKNQDFDYDLLDRLITAEGGYGELNYVYDEVGNRLSETRNGVTDAYTYDDDSNRVDSIARAGGNRTFTYDAVGNRITQNGNTTYTYNHANRLVSTSVNGAVTHYTYNPLGQRILKQLPDGQEEHYYYDENGQLIAVHDAAGTVQREYLYWGSQPIVLIARPGASASSISPAKVEAEHYTAYYDTTPGNQGNRACGNDDVDMGMTPDVGGGCQIGNATAGEWLEYPIHVAVAGTYNVTFRAAANNTGRALRLQVNGTTAANNIAIPALGWATYSDVTVPVTFTAGSHTLRVVWIQGGVNLNYLRFAPSTTTVATPKLYYLHNDHLNATHVITDITQQVAWMADYEPFGKITEGQNNSIAHYSRFPGQYVDQETGTYYNYFRDYDPTIGRYIQSDPIGLEGGINTYAYVSANPLKYTDPYGLVCFDSACLQRAREAGNAAKAAKDIGKALAPSAAEKKDCETCDDKPCDPPVGTMCYIGPHAGIEEYPQLKDSTTGVHYHIFKMSQNPKDCKCYWNKDKNGFGKGAVSDVIPPGVFLCDIYPSFNGQL